MPAIDHDGAVVNMLQALGLGPEFHAFADMLRDDARTHAQATMVNFSESGGYLPSLFILS